jgi:hypothetical protein
MVRREPAVKLDKYTAAGCRVSGVALVKIKLDGDTNSSVIAGGRVRVGKANFP